MLPTDSQNTPRTVPNYPGMSFQECVHYATQEQKMLNSYRLEAAELEKDYAYILELAMLYTKIGMCAMELWDWKSASEYLTHATQVYQANLSDTHGITTSNYLAPLHRELVRCYAAQAAETTSNVDLHLKTVDYCKQYLLHDNLSQPAEAKTDSAREERHSINIILGKSLNSLGLTQQALLAFLEISQSGLEHIDPQTFIEMTLGIAESDYLAGNYVTAMNSVQMAARTAKAGGFSDQLARAYMLEANIGQAQNH